MVGLLHLASGQACFRMAFTPFLIKYYTLIIKTNEMHYFSSLFGKELLHVSDRFTVYHQEY